MGGIKLTPEWITGFIEGEGSFTITVMRHANTKTGIEFSPKFRVELQADDLPILNNLKRYWRFGRVLLCPASSPRYKRAEIKATDHYCYQVTSLYYCMKLAHFFKKCEFRTKKRKQFELWCTILELLSNKEHLSIAGVNKILSMLGK